MSHRLHSWSVTPGEAIRIQRELIRPALRFCRLRRRVRLIGGADVAFDKADKNAFCAIVVWDRREERLVASATSVVPLTFPYVPGLLTFREGPAVVAAWEKLASRPDVLMFDGAGYAHPRRCGLACHLGLVLDVPAIGVAKSRLCGRADEPAFARGSAADLVHEGERIGKVLRTRDGIKPVFVSAGFRVTLADAVRLTLACATRYRLPEPTRLAHQAVTGLKKCRMTNVE